MFGSFIRSALAAALVALAVAPASAGSPADIGTARCQPSGDGGHQLCVVPLNKSLILDLPRDARDVLVSNPGIADVVVRTSRRIYLTGIAVGQTNLFVFDAAGDTIVSLDLQVERDISGLEDTLRRLIPGSIILVEMINDNIILSGRVQNAADALRANEIAGVFANAGGGAVAPADGVVAGAAVAGRPSSVVNLLTIEGEDQVMLKVTIAEVQRNTVKQLGISWNLENISVGGGMIFGAATGAAFPVTGHGPTHNLTAALVRNITVPTPGGAPGETMNARSAIGPTIQALEQTGLLRMLAEPTLTAISGELATFLAGGEFPVPTGRGADGAVTVEYKHFGVSLAFTPVVLSDGRISLHVLVEVSELSNAGAVVLQNITLPSISVRRTETTLELPSGGALVMSGLLQDTVREAIDGLPGLRQIPVLGAMFGSRDYQRNETELVIIVTPYLVEPVAPSTLATPGQGLGVPGDVGATFFGQLNLRYGVQGQTGAGAYHGNPGFIIP